MPNKAEIQIAKREGDSKNPFNMMAGFSGTDSPEATRLRNEIWGPLTSGQFRAANGNVASLSLPEYGKGIEAFLGTKPAHPQPQAAAQSLGYPPEVLQFLLKHYGSLFGDYTSNTQP